MARWKITEHTYPGRGTEYIVKCDGRIMCSAYSRSQAESMMASLRKKWS